MEISALRWSYNVLKGLALVGVLMVLTACPGKDNTALPEEEPAAPAIEEETVEEPSFNIDTSDEVSFNEADLDAQFQAEVDENLKPIYFDYNMAVLSAEATSRLQTAQEFLSKYPNVRVLIEGHADERGSAEYNMGLGERRAQKVKEYLVNLGTPSLSLEITTWGKERPQIPNCADEECHSMNRRAEFKVLGR